VCTVCNVPPYTCGRSAVKRPMMTARRRQVPRTAPALVGVLELAGFLRLGGVKATEGTDPHPDLR